jgi:hypothetical protein
MRKHVTIALLFTALLCACATAPSATPLNADAFTQQLAAKVQQRMGTVPIKIIGPLTLSVGAAGQANLDRLYAYCQSNSEGCAAETDHYLKGIAEAFQTIDQPAKAENIRLVIRTAEYVASAQRSVGGGPKALLTKPLAGNLLAVAVLDSPQTLQMLNQESASSLHLNTDQAFQRGQANLQATLKPLMQVAIPAVAGSIGFFGESVSTPAASSPPHYGHLWRQPRAAS